MLQYFESSADDLRFASELEQHVFIALDYDSLTAGNLNNQLSFSLIGIHHSDGRKPKQYLFRQIHN